MEIPPDDEKNEFAVNISTEPDVPLADDPDINISEPPGRAERLLVEPPKIVTFPPNPDPLLPEPIKISPAAP